MACIKIAICDDEMRETAKIERLLEMAAKTFGSRIETEIFLSGSSLFKAIESGEKYQILYLDVEMKSENGVDVARRLREIEKEMIIIYVSGHETYAKETFEVNAFRFLTKPIEKERFFVYFKSAIEILQKSSQYFVYQFKKQMIRISINEILYFESRLHTTYVMTVNEDRKCSKKLGEIAKELNEQEIIFLRVHQSFLVNPLHVMQYKSDELILKNGAKIPISRNRRKELENIYWSLKEEKSIE